LNLLRFDQGAFLTSCPILCLPCPFILWLMLPFSLAWNAAHLKSPDSVWVDRLWAIALFLLALLLFCWNLGGVPLRDWDESIVAQVARDIWRSQTGLAGMMPSGSLTWLYPTLGGAPYLNKPPLIHSLVALAYSIGGVNEWTSRLPGALLTTISVPLLYGIGREIFLTRSSAIFSALVYLTLLPVVRNGRLAMLDGAILCFFLLLLWCLLRSRRDLRWGLGVGLAFGCLCLIKGMVAVLLGAIALGFLWLDTPRLLTTGFIWGGILLGCLPAGLWYGAQWQHYGLNFITESLVNQSFNRIWLPVERNDGAPWYVFYYVLEILKYSLPWLLFLPAGWRLVWEDRNLSWAKLVLVWLLGYLIPISLMHTKLPWYVLPVYPALALVVGASLSTVWRKTDVIGLRQIPKTPYPIWWSIGLGAIAIAAVYLASPYSPLSQETQPHLQIVFIALALTTTATTILLMRRNSQFIPVLWWGVYVCLFLFIASPYWNWELGESYPVKPIAAMVQRHTQPGQVIFTSYGYNRPSLNFYSDRRVVPAPPEQLQTSWTQTPSSYLLLDSASLTTLSLPAMQPLETTEGWTLVTHASD